MPSFETLADMFNPLSVSDSPKGLSNTFKTHKNISLYFKRRYLIIYIKYFHGKQNIEGDENYINYTVYQCYFFGTSWKYISLF